MASRDYEYQGIRIDGIRELRSAFETAGVEITEDFKLIHKDVADTVISRARDLCPVAPASMTSAVPGLLRDSLRGSGTKRAAIARAGKKKIPYAAPIHWGWYERKIYPSLFLTHAAKDTEPEWVDKYYKKFESLLDKIADSTKGI